MSCRRDAGMPIAHEGQMPYLLLSHFWQHVAAFAAIFYISVCGRCKPKELRDFQCLAGSLRRGFCSPGVLRAQSFPAKTKGVLPPSRRGHGLFRAGRSLLCWPSYFSTSLMHRWVWGCTSGVHLPPFHTPKGVCSTCLIVLWMDKENLMENLTLPHKASLFRVHAMIIKKVAW